MPLLVAVLILQGCGGGEPREPERVDGILVAGDGAAAPAAIGHSFDAAIRADPTAAPVPDDAAVVPPRSLTEAPVAD
jgi:hypothetical protein